MHQPPNVPNYGRPGRGPKLERGLALAVEPMVTLGSKHTDLAEDEWTVITDDGSWAAHYEHTFTLTPDGRLGADRARRRRGQAGRARRPLRRELSRSARAAMLPFALLSIRAERAAVDDEHASFLRFTGLAETDLRRVDARARGAAGPVDLDAWSGIILGGGPWNASDPEDTKSPAQLAAEKWSGRPARRRGRSRLPLPRGLLRHRHPRQPPGWSGRPAAARAGGSARGVADRRGAWPTRSSPACRSTSRRTAATRRRLTRLPDGAVRLATSAACPVQAFRVGRQRLRDPVPPRARRRRGLHPDRGLQGRAATSTRAEAEALKACRARLSRCATR